MFFKLGGIQRLDLSIDLFSGALAVSTKASLQGFYPLTQVKCLHERDREKLFATLVTFIFAGKFRNILINLVRSCIEGFHELGVSIEKGAMRHERTITSTPSNDNRTVKKVCGGHPLQP
jgi:hypothetical protein